MLRLLSRVNADAVLGEINTRLVPALNDTGVAALPAFGLDLTSVLDADKYPRPVSHSPVGTLDASTASMT
jgi:hypothetical protein